MTVENPPFDATPLVRDEVAALIRGIVDGLVEERLKAAGIGPNGINVPFLLGDLAIPTGRALVAKSSPLKVENPASPAVIAFETVNLKALWAFVLTPAVGADIHVEVMRWRGGSASSMHLSGHPLVIAAGANVGTLGLVNLALVSVNRGDWVYFKTTQVGTTTKGDLLSVVVEFDSPIRRGRDF